MPSFVPVKSSLALAVSFALSVIALGASAPAAHAHDNHSSLIASKGFYPELIADVAEQVAPSVVNIDIERRSDALPGMQGNLPPGMNEFFQRFGFGGGDSPFKLYMPNVPSVLTGNGSGIIIDADGHILTNNHVIADTDKITVTLQSGEKFPGTVVGRDAYSDLALVKIDVPASVHLTPAKLGDSASLRPGDWVLAIGSPAGFDHTVTLGIISGISRHVPDLNTNMNYIQTDAAINPGNSGGPLVDLNGDVVGINTAIYAQGQNLGFAIPIDVAKPVLTALATTGHIDRPYLGIAMTDLNPRLAKGLGLSDNATGAVISRVMPDSPAAQAGFQQGDVIQRIDGQPVTGADAVQAMIKDRPVPSSFNVQILRNGQMMDLSVTSQQLPDEPPHPHAN